MNSNNPILQLIEETRAEFGQSRPFQAIVSLGTGRRPAADPSSRLLEMIQLAIN